MFVSQSHFPQSVLWLWHSADFMLRPPWKQPPRATGLRQSCVSVRKAAKAVSAAPRLGW